MLTDFTADTRVKALDRRRVCCSGAREDGSYLYLVAGGVLSRSENAECGERAVTGAAQSLCPALRRQGGLPAWKASFVAALGAGDAPDWEPEGGGESRYDLDRMTARVSPDGRYLAFMSARSLTGYDNLDANSGQPDEEVFLYRRRKPGGLVCASCDPTGARPVGSQHVTRRILR